jgi:hypothetical protein
MIIWGSALGKPYAEGFGAFLGLGYTRDPMTQFFPFFSSELNEELNILNYDYTEFLVYVLIPIILFITYKMIIYKRNNITK